MAALNGIVIVPRTIPICVPVTVTVASVGILCHETARRRKGPRVDIPSAAEMEQVASLLTLVLILWRQPTLSFASLGKWRHESNVTLVMKCVRVLAQVDDAILVLVVLMTTVNICGHGVEVASHLLSPTLTLSQSRVWLIPSRSCVELTVIVLFGPDRHHVGTVREARSLTEVDLMS